MNQGVWTPLFICFRAPDALETKMLIEAHRLDILFIHIGRKVWQDAQRVLNERAPNARSTMQRIDKQSLHVSTLEKHESYRMIRVVDGQPKRGVLQDSDSLGINLLPVAQR